jgi:hypothetical protein
MFSFKKEVFLLSFRLRHYEMNCSGIFISVSKLLMFDQHYFGFVSKSSLCTRIKFQIHPQYQKRNLIRKKGTHIRGKTLLSISKSLAHPLFLLIVHFNKSHHAQQLYYEERKPDTSHSADGPIPIINSSHKTRKNIMFFVRTPNPACVRYLIPISIIENWGHLLFGVKTLLFSQIHTIRIIMS